jgi:hypothetical protein
MLLNSVLWTSASIPRTGAVPLKKSSGKFNFRLEPDVGNLPPMPGVFPDYPAPVVRNVGAELELTMMRRGMPPPSANRHCA